jgi:hypothetical protein
MQMVWVTTKPRATTMEVGDRNTPSGRFVRRTIIKMTIVQTMAVAPQLNMTTGEEAAPGRSRQFHRVHILANHTRINSRRRKT